MELKNMHFDCSIENRTNKYNQRDIYQGQVNTVDENDEAYNFRNFMSILRNINFKTRSNLSSYYKLNFFSNPDKNINKQKKYEMLDYFEKYFKEDYVTHKKPYETIKAFMDFLDIESEDPDIKHYFIRIVLTEYMKIYKNKVRSSYNAAMRDFIYYVLENSYFNLYDNFGSDDDIFTYERKHADAQITLRKLTIETLDQPMKLLYDRTIGKVLPKDHEHRTIFKCLMTFILEMIIDCDIFLKRDNGEDGDDEQDLTSRYKMDYSSILKPEYSGSPEFNRFVFGLRRSDKNAIENRKPLFGSPSIGLYQMFRNSKWYNSFLVGCDHLRDEFLIPTADKMLAIMRLGIFRYEIENFFTIALKLTYRDTHYLRLSDIENMFSIDYNKSQVANTNDCFDHISSPYMSNTDLNTSCRFVDIYNAGNSFNYKYENLLEGMSSVTFNHSFSDMLFDSDELSSLIKLTLDVNLENFNESFKKLSDGWDKKGYNFIDYAFKNLIESNNDIYKDDCPLPRYEREFFNMNNICNSFTMMGSLKNYICMSFSDCKDKNHEIHNWIQMLRDNKGNNKVNILKDMDIHKAVQIAPNIFSKMIVEGSYEDTTCVSMKQEIDIENQIWTPSAWTFLTTIREEITKLQDVKFYSCIHLLLTEFYLAYISGKLYQNHKMRMEGYLILAILGDDKIYNKSSKLLMNMKMKDKLPKKTILAYREYMNRILMIMNNQRNYLPSSDSWLVHIKFSRLCYRKDKESNSQILASMDTKFNLEEPNSSIEVLGMKRFYDYFIDILK